MDIKGVKKWWDYPDRKGCYAAPVAERIDWLIAEHNRLTAELTSAKEEIERLKAERNLFKKETVALAKDALAYQSVLNEVSGCHTEHGTPKLCEGCLLSIAALQSRQGEE